MNSIPKVIHYCWFGGNPLPEMALKCIESWKKFLPDYEIKEWNEKNFDLNICEYVKEAYQAKKWAFVSDYARFWILYHEGGVYFDTDVEVIKPFEDIVDNGAFMGCEVTERKKKLNTDIAVNPGLGLGAPAGLSLYKEILEFYENRHFFDQYGDNDTTTVVYYTTKILVKHGWKPSNNVESVSNISIYSPEYFCPINYRTGEMVITDKTHSIHHYAASWHSEEEEKMMVVARFCQNHFGNRIGRIISKTVCLPWQIKIKANRIGLKKTLIFCISELKNRVFTHRTRKPE